MASEPLTCDVCESLITDDRGGELAIMLGGTELVWVHEACMAGYNRVNNARWSYLALAEDPLEIDRDGWVPLSAIEQQRGLWQSDNADFVVGLKELMDFNWVEANADKSAFRLTPDGERQRKAFGLSNDAWA